jgi:putative heme-binding domain-containing protein
LAPSPAQAKMLISGLQKGLLGSDASALPADLVQALQPYQALFQKESLALELRQGKKTALDQALVKIADRKADVNERLSYIRILGEIHQPQAVPALLEIMESEQSSGLLRKTALQALQRYEEAEIGLRVIKAFPDKLRVDRDVFETALNLFASRTLWAKQFIQAIDQKQRINKEEIPDQVIRRFKLLNDPFIEQAVARLWPDVRLATSTEKNKRILEVSQLLKSGSGNSTAGRAVFNSVCGSCHRLFEEGGTLGPDLTGYDRRNVSDILLNTIDPNADIREGYGMYHITTTDGRTLVGKITAQNGETISLQPLGGDNINLAAKQIKEMKAQKTSLMPERLLEGLTDQQIRDLYAYITKL